MFSRGRLVNSLKDLLCKNYCNFLRDCFGAAWDDFYLECVGRQKKERMTWKQQKVAITSHAISYQYCEELENPLEFVELLSVKDVTTRIHLHRCMTSSSFDLPYFTFLIPDTKQDFRPEHLLPNLTLQQNFPSYIRLKVQLRGLVFMSTTWVDFS